MSDMISKQAALGALEERRDRYLKDSPTWLQIQLDIHAIAALPPADDAVEAHDEQLGVWADELMADLVLNDLMDLVDHEYDTKVGARRTIIAALELAPDVAELVKALAPLIVREAGNERPDALAAIARMGAWSGAGRVGGMYEHPGYRKPYPIQTVLRDLASQEGCDGEPYDAMVFAASYIDCIIAHIAALTAERDRFEAALSRACLVGGTTYLVERAEAAEAEAAALRAKVARLEGALTDMPKAVLRTTVCQGPQWPDDRPGVWLAALEACAKSVQAAVDAAISEGGKDG